MTDQAHHDCEARKSDDGRGSTSPFVVTSPANRLLAYQIIPICENKENFMFFEILLCKQEGDDQVENPILEDKEDVDDSKEHLIRHLLLLTCV